MATYVKLKNGRWKAIVRITGQPIQCKTKDRKRDAEEWAQGVERDLRANNEMSPEERHLTRAKQLTFSEVLPQYLALPARKHLKSLAAVNRILESWIPILGRYTFRELEVFGTRLIADETDRMQNAGLGPASVNRRLGWLNTFFVWCMSQRMKLLATNPCKGVERPKEPEGRVRYLSEDERKRLFAACQESTSKWLYPFVVLAVYTGMRRGELLALTWDNVDLTKGTVTVTTSKNGKPRTIPIRGIALDTLREWRGNVVHAFGSTHSVFGQKVFGSKAWYTALAASGVEDFHEHDLRHTYASYLAIAGVPVLTISKLLGHANTSMTERYAHLNTKHLEDAVSEMVALNS